LKVLLFVTVVETIYRENSLLLLFYYEMEVSIPGGYTVHMCMVSGCWNLREQEVKAKKNSATADI
jgi:hypothetical protein